MSYVGIIVAQVLGGRTIRVNEVKKNSGKTLSRDGSFRDRGDKDRDRRESRDRDRSGYVCYTLEHDLGSPPRISVFKFIDFKFVCLAAPLHDKVNLTNGVWVHQTWS